MSNRIELANAIRALSMDAVQQANSGHPGMPMGMADLAEVLWRDNLKHNPANPNWADRDRFVLSNGHGSMLLYSLLHLTGYDLPISELKNFRQLHSKTPGHPEYREAPGVETTTGPLGQGVANAVGMALAEKVLANRFNRGGHQIVDHHTWVFLGDGCLMEGVSHEACSLAGRFGLGKLIAFWDDNGISIDGEVEGWFTDDTPARFEAYGWQVIRGVDGHDPVEIQQAIDTARAETSRPTLICARTVIGFGSPNKQGTEATHGAPLGEEEVAATRTNLGWEYPPFEIPAEIREAWDAQAAGRASESAWNEKFNAFRRDFAGLAEEFERRMNGLMPDNWEQETQRIIVELQAAGGDVATRKSSQIALNAFGPLLPELIGGSADLAGSNNTIWSGSVDVNDGTENGNYVYFGVREFGMTAICNGISLHGGFTPYSATFLVFSDYARNAVRMSALLPVRNIHVYTHDSIGLGEDGPTHQPVEHVASLRLIPNLDVWRPCDTVESAVAWKCALESELPSALIFTRQGLPHQDRSSEQLENIARGGYVLVEAQADAHAVIIATGSEIALAVAAANELSSEGVNVRVVSMPNPGLFQQQDAAYREAVLPSTLTARVVVEAGVTAGWAAMAGNRGRVVGIDRFGASAPANELFKEYGLTVENVSQAVRDSLSAD
ncbi:MAG: transketolase [Xanthomonadales bacterium]|jgi:transketolase|nr:transketolase [Xanthomonadales bacterium]MDH3923133.1 transketolase [Xanthomonadales bacterium]MDH3940320.1 transketolase [Xanthomonadales bacterium]MDH4000202.1 transketolase [Xanthomonadales bacterium]